MAKITNYPRTRVQRRFQIGSLGDWLIPLVVFVAVAFFGSIYLQSNPVDTAPRDASTYSDIFPICGSARRITCVVDGDTIWHHGVNIRISDINTPEVSQPFCAREAELGRQATVRLQTLLNAGPFEIARAESRDEDQYGRKLRVILRDGNSLGAILVAEGLAEFWTGSKGDWCA